MWSNTSKKDQSPFEFFTHRYASPPSTDEIERTLESYISHLRENYRSILLVVPDKTRAKSMADRIAAILYRRLAATHSIKFIIATGTHQPMNSHEIATFYKGIPTDFFINHRFLEDSIPLGVFSNEELKSLLKNSPLAQKFPFSVEISLNRELFKGYDLIVSIGQVVPHEVVGMSNYTKNILVGLGGKDIIDKTHYLSALLGIENIVGVTENPVRTLVDRILEKASIPSPVHYLLTVIDSHQALASLTITEDRLGFLEAAKHSTECNVYSFDKGFDNVVAYLPPYLTTTWVGNKAIYRLRKLINDGGTLHIIFGHVQAIGENSEAQGIFEQYGYLSTEILAERVEKDPVLQSNLSLCAHMMHSDPMGRFKVIWYVKEDKLPLFQRVRLEALPLSKQPLLEEMENAFVCEDPAMGLWERRQTPKSV